MEMFVMFVVTVYTTKGSELKFKDCVEFEIDNGVLTILNEHYENTHAFAPGHWESVSMEEVDE